VEAHILKMQPQWVPCSPRLLSMSDSPQGLMSD